MLGGTAIAGTEIEYRFTSIHIGERPQAINNLNQVVGAINNQAFYWDNGVVTDLGMGSNSIAYDINDSGAIVGTQVSSFDSALRSMFIYESSDGSALEANYHRRRLSTKINNNGQVLIDYGNRNFDSYGAFYESGNVSEINIDTFNEKYPYDGHFIYVEDINSLGQIVGKRRSDFLNLDFPHEGFLWQNGTNISLGNFLPDDINDNGQMLGYVDGKRTFYDNGDVVELADGFTPISLNNVGQVFGYSDDGYQIWQDGVISDIKFDSSADGWKIYWAVEMNDNGWIIGTATNDLTGDEHMYVLSPTSQVSPVPETDTFVLFSFGLIGFLALHRRRVIQQCKFFN